MEIQHGKGPWAPPVSGIVPLGSTLTLVVAINDYRGKPLQINPLRITSVHFIIDTEYVTNLNSLSIHPFVMKNLVFQ